MLNRYPVCTDLISASSNCEAREWLSVWGRSGPEGSKRSQKLEAAASRGVRRPVLQKEVAGEIMKMFEQIKRYAEEERKGNKIMESFSARLRGEL